MKDEWDPIFAVYLEEERAWRARDNKRRDDEFAQLPTPTAEAEHDLQRFLAKYFLDGLNGQPDKSKSPNPIALPGYSNRSTVHQAAERIDGLHTHSGGEGYDDRTIVIGWDRAAVWRLAGEFGAASWERKKKQKQQVWEESLNEHRSFVEEGKKNPNIGLLKSYTGSYLIDCKTLSDGWDIENDMTLDIDESTDPKVLQAAFDFGVLDGTMLLSFSESVIREYASTLVDFDSEDREEDLEDEAVGAKRKANAPAKTRKKAAKAESANTTRTLHLQWRGRETGEGVIQLDEDTDPSHIGQLKWTDGSLTKFIGAVKIPFVSRDLVRFVGYKVDANPREAPEDWNNFSESQYERERVGRWG
jgi:hypothetical protein